MIDPKSDLADLIGRLEKGAEPPSEPLARQASKPTYILVVDDPDERSILLIIRTSADGVLRGTVVLPQWYEIPEMWDGPHTMDIALQLVDDYAHEYGYQAVAIDIESSQLWQAEWGVLETGQLAE